MQLIYPANEFNSKQPDELFKDEYFAAKEAGLSCVLYIQKQRGLEFCEPLIKNEEIIYRGWMLKPYVYSKLNNQIQRHGAQLITYPEYYEDCHHLPNWYDKLSQYTAQTIFCEKDDNFYEVLKSSTWNKYFIKDYVKSLTTTRGSVAETISDIPKIINLIEKYRGSIEGGICIREFEEYLPNTEERYFVFKNKIYSRTGFIPSIVTEITNYVYSPFYSIDIVIDVLNNYRLIEIGDGQVSDYKNWDAEQFVQIFK